MNIVIDNAKIRDELGRQRIFKGINLCYKLETLTAEEEQKIRENLDADIKNMVDNGVSMVRLGFTWSMLEPEEGVYDDKAFALIRDITEALGKSNIAVLLDMHQDLFNAVNFGDGAPAWATERYDVEKPLAVWAEGYFYMSAVQKCFDDFWNNKNGIQDKFVAVWKEMIARVGCLDNVVAIDYFNEPQIHNNSNKVFCNIVNNGVNAAYGKKFDAAKYFADGKEKKGFLKMAIRLGAIMVAHGGPFRFLKKIDDYSAFAKMVSGNDEYVQDFNKNYYQPFFNKLVRECGVEDKLNFFEHSYYSNLGMPFEIETEKPCVYSPHAYDLFIDSPLYNKFCSNERVRYILEHIRENQEKMAVPVIMGEWGGSCYEGHVWLEHIEYVYNVFEGYQWSNLYWHYMFEDEEFVKVMNRPYPVAISGDIISYSSNSKARTFELEYTKTIDAPSLIYVPGKGIIEVEETMGENKISITY